MLTTTRKVEIGGAIALLAVAAFLFFNWLSAHDSQVQASAVVTAQEKVIAAAQQSIQQLKDDQVKRDAATAQQLDAMQRLVAQIRTPQQIAQWIPQQLPGPQPVTITVPQATAQNPNPDAIASIPQADLPFIRDALEQCKECGVKLTKAQTDIESRDSQLKLAGQQMSAAENERDAWKKAARGTFWGNTKKALKWMAIGGGIALGGICGTGHCK